ncbi:MAG TPA: DUF4349 domain-containing protein, partial [Gemmatimonadaceae bacterium]|nr:DUF4349 domain-containing protein [Gemmatimonadaceae bacterium]
MRRFARAPMASLAFVSILTLVACGEDSATDEAVTRTDAVFSNAPPSGAPAGGSGGASEGDMSARRREFAEQQKIAPAGGTAGVMGAAAVAPDQQSGADPLQGIGQFNTGAVSMMIRTGQAFIEVEQLDPAILKIRQLAAQVGGFIANSSITGGRDQIRQATFELKIPAARYD